MLFDEALTFERKEHGCNLLGIAPTYMQQRYVKHIMNNGMNVVVEYSKYIIASSQLLANGIPIHIRLFCTAMICLVIFCSNLYHLVTYYYVTDLERSILKLDCVFILSSTWIGTKRKYASRSYITHEAFRSPIFTKVIASDCMMKSSNGNIFRVTGHLCGELTGPRWIPRTKASKVELWCFLWSASE